VEAKEAKPTELPETKEKPKPSQEIAPQNKKIELELQNKINELNKLQDQKMSKSTAKHKE